MAPASMPQQAVFDFLGAPATHQMREAFCTTAAGMQPDTNF